jgi:hypothetical protein
MSHAIALSAVSTIFGGFTFIFYIVGCVGYSASRDPIMNTAWITYDVQDDDYNSFSPKVYVGLQKVLFTINSKYNALFPWKSCGSGDDGYDDYDDDSDFCNACHNDGKATFGLLVIASICAFIVTGLSFLSVKTPSPTITIANLIAAFISGLFGVIGFGLFMHDCYSKLDDAAVGNLQYGPGSITTLVGFLLMWIVVVLQIAMAAIGSK